MWDVIVLISDHCLSIYLECNITPSSRYCFITINPHLRILLYCNDKMPP